MKKNIATPIAEIKKQNALSAEIARLEAYIPMPDAKKQSEIERINSIIDPADDDTYLPLAKELADIQQTMTETELRDRLADLRAQQKEILIHGLVDLTDAEHEQRKKDENAHDEFLRKHQYKYSRADEYPSIADQLDALWKGRKEAEAMAARVKAVKDKYPKPEGSNV